MNDLFGDIKGILPIFIGVIMLSVVANLITPGTAGAKTLVSITITGNPSLVYDPSQPSGATQQLHVIGMYDDASTADLTSSAALTTSNAGVATISPLGVLTAVGVGSVTITATIGTLTATFNVTVTSPAPDRTIIDIVWD